MIMEERRRGGMGRNGVEGVVVQIEPESGS